ncbi:organic solvent tolerance protein OstA [Hydrococcus rivularis NIES-593]|uniref:Organic solvent tolerance protein OstA n=1 Tax=Hydrococcus rivularis NIES-593 TaxID=1921803 RepID=A0A1U7HLH6_9CYAN|nr:organic solvent tolerance protein OstA [Hydrococcus rivularis NIES-593]
MLPDLPPDNPPAFIQSIAPEKVSDSQRDRNGDRSNSVDSTGEEWKVEPGQTIPIYSQRDSTSVLFPSLLSLKPSKSLSQPTQTTPAVVEFSDVPSQEVASPVSNEKSAASLGKSISVGYGTFNRDRTLWNSSFTKSSQSKVIKGLEQISLSDEVQMAKVLVTRQRGGAVREFQLTAQEPPPGSESPPQQEPTSVVEVIADRQEYDSQREIITATGNVEIRFPNGVLVADRVQVNLPDRLAVAEGEVVLTRGQQVLRGQRFEYYFVQDSGVILQANGEIYQPTTNRDFSPTLPTDVGTEAVVPNQPLSDRLALNQPLQRVTTAEGYRFSIGGGGAGRVGQPGGTATGAAGGRINRIRFQADRVDFDAERWTATNVRVTNDPFSPPELELRAQSATYRNIAPLIDEVAFTDSRVVFDQSLSIPTFQDRLIVDRRPRQPGLFSIGYDGRDRGGLFIERGFKIIDTQNVNFEIRPQYLLQRAFFPDTFDTDDDIDEDVSPLSLSAVGLVSDLEIGLGPRTSLKAVGSFSSLDFDNIDDNLRARIELQQKIGDLNNPYDLRFGYNYRERIFNGSLGFRTVNNSIGATLVSPTIPLGNTGINLSYQASIQHIEASTDRPELLKPDREDNLVDLTRYQGAASLSRGFMLWQGQALPPTPEAGLRYTPTPVQPYLQLTAGVTGVASYYSNGDSQPSLTGSIGLLGQLGHFSRPFLDYTGFNVTYSQGIRGDASPFLFDRFADTQTLSWGITQQVYGPLRVGIQSSLSLSESEEISTDYFIEFSRRTYNILLRYNPVLEIGSISLRINDFNWSGNPGPLDGTDIRPVIRGVTR